jgi:hypothetical protein
VSIFAGLPLLLLTLPVYLGYPEDLAFASAHACMDANCPAMELLSGTIRRRQPAITPPVTGTPSTKAWTIVSFTAASS